MNRIYFILFPLLFVLACQDQEPPADAYGNFEAREIFLASERAGKLLTFPVEEGQWLDSGVLVAVVDTTPLDLQRQQLFAQIDAVLSRSQEVEPQLAVYDEELKNLQREQRRMEALVQEDAATSQALDEISGKILVVQQRKAAHLSQLKNANQSVRSEVQPLRLQLAQIEDQIARSIIKTPEAGRVLVTYAEPGELAMPGRPLLKLADTEDMTLRFYVSGSQLAQISIGQEVTVLFDRGEDALAKTQGAISWIADQAEFTPKSIQTREERVDLVYEAKLSVANPEGNLKIGMPGEVRW